MPIDNGNRDYAVGYAEAVTAADEIKEFLPANAGNCGCNDWKDY